MIRNLFLICLKPIWCFGQTRIGSNIMGNAAGDDLGYSVSLSITGNILAIGAPRSDGNGANSGQVLVIKNQFLTCSQISG